ncbi:glucosamine-6-phosphate deaminase [Bacillus sp. BGMRC 2118]|nr:glucosamine-6-phosphate deaminase [Bacillus sp. BGMRC 2118]
MKVIQVKNYDELSQTAAAYIINIVKKTPDVTLGLPTGGTPKGTYQVLIDDHKKNQTTYHNVKSINLDEYVGLAPANPNSYRYYMNEHFFRHVDINPVNTHLPDGTALDIHKECYRYDTLISQLGGIDLQILGIGTNGHIGFNEPGTSFKSKTHIVKLAESTRVANARYFQSIEDVPTEAITMGIATILESKEILLLAHGDEKADAMDQLIHGGISRIFPASALKNHSNCTIIADEKALSKVKVRSLS